MHTFHELDALQELTTSTDSTRRASSTSGLPATPGQQNSTTHSHTGDTSDLIFFQNDDGKPNANSAARSSRDDDTMASAAYSSDSEPADAVEEVIDEEDEDDGSSNSDSEDGTMMTIDTEDITGVSMASDGFDEDDEGDGSSTLDQALRLAAQRANTQRLDEEEGEEIIPSFGWVKKPTQGTGAPTQQPAQRPADATEVGMDMDLTTAMGGIVNTQLTEEIEADEDMSMDVTRVLGGILAQQQVGMPENEDSQSNSGEATMEFTTAIGAIQDDSYNDEFADDEGMSMELTTVLGGVLSQQKRKSIAAPRRQTISQMSDADDAMDMTVGIGNILPTEADESVVPDDGNETMGMDMTVAMGGIMQSPGPSDAQFSAKRLSRSHANFFVPDSSPIVLSPKRASPKRPLSVPEKQPSPDLLSPGLLPVRSKPSRSSEAVPTPRITRSRSRTPSPKKSPNKSDTSTVSNLRRLSQEAKPITPTKLMKPQSTTSTPSRSSQRLTARASRQSTGGPLAENRKLSGFGADRDGLGSPSVAKIIDRRASIGDSAADFVSGKNLISFESPRHFAEQLRKEELQNFQEHEQRHGRHVQLLAPGQEDREATLTLMDLIDTMSPAKKPLNGRKSLHVGSARGVLGKRPAELDDEEAEELDGVDKLIGLPVSPVKKIRLQKPTIATDIGKLSLHNTMPLDYLGTPHALSPVKGAAPATSPRKFGGFKDLKQHHTIHNLNLEPHVGTNGNDVDSQSQSGQIHLQDFLDMTSIRFMELNTTKRRHTTAPTHSMDGRRSSDGDDMSLERCVIASACTVPKLELYQHSCRELKKYISEGRRMVKEIEADTFEENPPLFKEYISATPDVRALMDNQFKNVRTHARLLSKAMWYEWRMKLQDGLKEGLVTINNDMENDYAILKRREQLLGSALPELEAQYDRLESQRQDLQSAAQEIADCDPEVLNSTRDDLVSLKEQIEEKTRLLEELRDEYKTSEAHVDDLSSKKSDILADIAQSEKTREDCRGWSSAEVRALQGKHHSVTGCLLYILMKILLTERVDGLEKDYGWAVTGISGATISMSYKREIELVLDISSFQPNGKRSQIDLWYIADSREARPLPRTTEKEFFLQCIRENIRSVVQASTDVRSILEMVQRDWDKAMFASEQLRKINSTFPTVVTKTSDTSIEVKISMLLRQLETRVELALEFQGQIGKGDVDVGISSSATVPYGQHFNVAKIKDFLGTRIGSGLKSSGETWVDALVELQGKLIARGRK